MEYIEINQWPLECQNQKHNFIGGEKIKFFIRKVDGESDNKLTCDTCRKYRVWKAITVGNTVWCSDCLSYYDENRSNSDEEIEQALKKIHESK